MSASLVGSEMCIRDSRYSIRSVFGACVIEYLPANRDAGLPRGTWGYRHCLLYTSDAADDM
eukprot:2069666-Alexandrium_andersonii.AAC.1